MTNNNQIQQFHSAEFGSLEILMIDGKLYFPATECAKKLGYTNPHKAIRDHCPHRTNRSVGVETGRKADGSPAIQTIEAVFIPEGDLYRLIIRSKLPVAVRFETWVFDEVLPTIRKYGAYIQPDTLDEMLASPELTAALLKELRKERAKNAALAPKARYCDSILQCKNAVPVSLIAKDYGMSATRFNRLLHNFRIQYNIAGTWLPYQQYAGQGYTLTRTYHVGERTSAMHTCWTQKGRLFLYDFLADYGILPLAEYSDGDDDYSGAFAAVV
ncbi:MAG: phage antirepressor KilAC domain-containing protein [Oscillospiraceae bacterium]|jgi:prophage antirepressor-like protein|nr:phage antirepressor KilAC domain-containing protein [Oscillospiraceae bacterium]